MISIEISDHVHQIMLGVIQAWNDAGELTNPEQRNTARRSAGAACAGVLNGLLDTIEGSTVRFNAAREALSGSTLHNPERTNPDEDLP